LKQSRRLRTLSADDGNPVYDIIQVFKLLFKERESDSGRGVLSKLRSLFSGEHRSRVFVYLCLNGAATAWEIQCELKMAEATTYRALKELKAIGLVVPALRAARNKRVKGGPRPIVWALEGASPREVADGLKRHYQMLPRPSRRSRSVDIVRMKVNG